MTHLNGTSAAALHQIADMSWLNTSSNEWFYIVVVQFLQLQTQLLCQKYMRMHENALGKEKQHHQNANI